jgi:hypothetical protein
MPDEKDTRRPEETNFLPPLSMVLTFLDRKLRKGNEPKKTADTKKETDEKNVEKLIEKLSEKEE